MREALQLIFVFVGIFGMVEWLLATIYCVFVEAKSKQMKEFMQVALFTTTIMSIIIVVTNCFKSNASESNNDQTSIILIIIMGIFTIGLSVMMTHVIFSEHKYIVMNKDLPF